MHEEAEDLGLLDLVTFEQQELETFSLLNHLYSNKELEYIVTGSKTFPMTGPLYTMNEKLLAAVGPLVGYVGLQPLRFARD